MDDLPLRRCVLLEKSQLPGCGPVAETGVQLVVVLTLPDHIVPGPEADALIQATLKEARKEAGDGVFLCPAIPAGDFFYEPYGETPFAAGVAHFHELAASCQAHGADCVMVHRAKSMLQARAGVLGARASGLPVLVSMEPIGEGGSLLGGTDLLSAYAVLRLLGIAAFGYASSVAGLQLDAFEVICPHRSIPLFSITKDLAGQLSAQDREELLVRRVSQLSRLGVTGVGLWGAGPAQLAATARAIRLDNPVLEDERGSLTAADLWAANETQVYYLDENVEFSEPVDCQLEMTDHVLAAEKEVCDLFCIRVNSQDEARAISVNNGTMDQMPVCFSSDDEEALEAALFYYNGRAVIDSRTHIPHEALERLEQAYGAMVL